MASTIQRNRIVAPFQTNTPFVEPSHIKNTAKGNINTATSGISRPQITWLQSVEAGVNASPQITATIPASSTSPGQPGTIAFDSNWLYCCVGLNTWRRTPLAIF